MVPDRRLLIELRKLKEDGGDWNILRSYDKNYVLTALDGWPQKVAHSWVDISCADDELAVTLLLAALMAVGRAMKAHTDKQISSAGDGIVKVVSAIRKARGHEESEKDEPDVHSMGQAQDG